MYGGISKTFRSLGAQDAPTLGRGSGWKDFGAALGYIGYKDFAPFLEARNR